MYKNQLQELAQRSCFNLPSYVCIREGPDHAPRFRASVNFNGEIFECPSYWSTLRQAEHAAAEVALNCLSIRGPSRSLTARVLDETGIYKNLLQETAHRAGLKLPQYITVRSGPGHVPVFTCTVEIAGFIFTGEPAKTKKQAEKNAAIVAWSALRKMPNMGFLSCKEGEAGEEDEEADVRRREQQNQARRRMVKGKNIQFQSHQYQNQKSLIDLLKESVPVPESSTQSSNSYVSLVPPPPPRTASKILPPISNRNMPIKIREKSVQVHHQKDEEEGKNDSTFNRSFSGKLSIAQILPLTGQSSKPQFSMEISVLKHHQRDEEEWLGGGEESLKDSIYNTPFNGKLNFAQIPPLKHQSSKSKMGKTEIYSGGFNFNPQRFAPAVQIRSVIPVCATPPPPTTMGSSSQQSTPMATESSKLGNLKLGIKNPDQNYSFK